MGRGLLLRRCSGAGLCSVTCLAIAVRQVWVLQQRDAVPVTHDGQQAHQVHLPSSSATGAGSTIPAVCSLTLRGLRRLAMLSRKAGSW